MASTYPTSLDNLSTQDVDNPDVVNSVNKMQTTHITSLQSQTVPYAATVTPDPAQGNTIVIGTLTGAITVNQPPVAAQIPGRRLVYEFTQDATGTRAVTFGAGFKVSATAVSTTASKVSTVEVVWDGTQWVQVGGVAGL